MRLPDRVTLSLEGYFEAMNPAETAGLTGKLRQLVQAIQPCLIEPIRVPPADASLHEATLELAALIERIGKRELAMQANEEAGILATKCGEYAEHLKGCCGAHGCNYPDGWARGVAFIPRWRERLAGLFGDPRKSRSMIRRHRHMVAATMEQFEHLLDLCREEFPRIELRRQARNLEQLAIRLERMGPLYEPLRVKIVESGNNRGRTPSIEVWYIPAIRAPASVTLAWRDSMPAEGSLCGDFELLVDRTVPSQEDDCLYLRVALDADQVWDPVFATVLAVTIEPGDPAVSRRRLGMGDQRELTFNLAFSPACPSHFATAWRYLERPKSPFLEVRFVMCADAGPLHYSFSRLFAGQHYDPYRFSPLFAATPSSRPASDKVASPLEAFATKATVASQQARYVATQAFIRPFLVHCEGPPAFALLIGTANSLSWYALAPTQPTDGISDLDLVREGDVVVDCGANAGQMSAYFALVAGKTGRVLAFDPFVQNCLLIEAQNALVGLDNIRAIAAGVGRERRRISVSNIAQMTVAPHAGDNDAHDEVEIDIVPLDDFIDEAPNVLKLDIEGAEVDALRGAQRLLVRHRPRLFIEAHTQYLGLFGHTLTDLFAAIPPDLYRIRLKVEGLDNAWRDYAPGAERGITVPLRVWAEPR